MIWISVCAVMISLVAIYVTHLIAPFEFIEYDEDEQV